MDLLEQHLQEDPKLQQKIHQIEQATKAFLNKEARLRSTSLITIPVVVHVVHKYPVENISDEQVFSQIRILNEDFRRMNSDAVDTPSEFLPVASDIEIEFCLATVDPNGNPTSGITRTFTSKASFGTNDDVKSFSSGGKDPWPATEYLNVWVCDIGDGVLGYAQFPGGSPATDGIVNDYRYFGDIGTAIAPFDRGRTMTHEVGHYLNLRHIWGDGNCSSDDFVSDTPRSSGPNYTGSPCIYPGPNSCNEGGNDQADMFQNYMDYSDDGCMNLFTLGQKYRMRALFEVGGARASLLNSQGCGEPIDPTCYDGIQNGEESGIDCGGPDCIPCPPGPTCSDGIQNGEETGIDCGGPLCVPCPCAGSDVEIVIILDNYPEETTWTLNDSTGIVVASGGDYGTEPDGSTVITDLFLVNGCYQFNIFDAYGDGICCNFGEGFYYITVADTIVGYGGNFTTSDSVQFCVERTIASTCEDDNQNGDETGIDCGGTVCNPCPPDSCTMIVIDSEDFEQGFGIWNDGGSDCALYGNSSYASSGDRSIRLRDNTAQSVLTSDPIDLSSYEQLELSFAFYARSMEKDEDFWLQLSTDGGLTFETIGVWVSGTDFQNDVLDTVTVSIKETTDTHSIFRFRCDASANSDQIYLDDITLIGCQSETWTEKQHFTQEASPLSVSDLNIYPNPASDQLNVHFALEEPGEFQLGLFNAEGKNLYADQMRGEKGNNELNIDLKEYKAGVYYLYIEHHDEHLVKKFVIIQ